MRTLCLTACIALLASPAMAEEFAPISDVELDEQRGGFMIAGQLTFGFAAMVRTFDEMGLALQTAIVWTPEGPRVTHQGVGASGGATFVHDVSGGDLMNLVRNTDSNRSIRQETDVTLVLPGFGPVQDGMARNLFGIRLGDDLGGAGAMAIGR